MSKIKIVDGKIISQQEHDLPASSATLPENDPLLEELKEFSMDLSPYTKKPNAPEAVTIHDFRFIDGIMISKDTPYLPSDYDPDALKTQEGICPYLLQNNAQDYGMFMDYLKHTNKKERTRYDYTISLRKWKSELEQLGGELKVDNLNKILGKFSVDRAYNLLVALRSYAKYRNLRGDKVLLVLLSSSHDLYHPVKERQTKEGGSLSEREAKHYRKLARKLCKEGKKTGIWIGLSLLGVTPGNLAAVEFPDKSHVCFMYRKQEQTRKIDTWLYKACQDIPDWRVGRRGIHHGVSEYGVNPHTLNRFAARNSAK